MKKLDEHKAILRCTHAEMGEIHQATYQSVTQTENLNTVFLKKENNCNHHEHHLVLRYLCKLSKPLNLQF